jgi:hypothetical protein
MSCLQCTNGIIHQSEIDHFNARPFEPTMDFLQVTLQASLQTFELRPVSIEPDPE